MYICLTMRIVRNDNERKDSDRRIELGNQTKTTYWASLWSSSSGASLPSEHVDSCCARRRPPCRAGSSPLPSRSPWGRPRAPRWHRSPCHRNWHRRTFWTIAKTRNCLGTDPWSIYQWVLSKSKMGEKYADRWESVWWNQMQWEQKKDTQKHTVWILREQSSLASQSTKTYLTNLH